MKSRRNQQWTIGGRHFVPIIRRLQVICIFLKQLLGIRKFVVNLESGNVQMRTQNFVFIKVANLGKIEKILNCVNLTLILSKKC